MHPDIINNKYFKCYERLISKHHGLEASQFTTECHHILPKCMGGSDRSDNLVNLPIRAHFIAHLLLWKCTMGTSNMKLGHAFYRMCFRGIKYNSKTYEQAKKASAVYSSIRNRSMLCAVDSEGRKYHIKNDDPRYISGALVAESRGRLLGIKQSPGHTQKISESQKGTSNSNHKWTIHTPNGIFDSTGSAARAYNTSRTTILNRCNNTNPQFEDWCKVVAR